MIDLDRFRERRQEEAWDRYVDLRAVAEASFDVADGLAAGRAFRDFLDLFLSPAQREEMCAADRAVLARLRR